MNTDASTPDYAARISEAFRNPETETDLGRAVARMRQPFQVGDGKKWLYEGVVSAFTALFDALRAIDDSIPPGLPPHLLDPAWIAKSFHIPLEDFNWQGIRPEGIVQCPGTEARAERLLRLKQCASLSGHSVSTLRRAIKDGRLKTHTVGRGRSRPTYGISRGDLQAYIEAGRLQPPDPPRFPTTGVRKKSRHFD